MKKAKKRAHILLALGIFSIISAVAGTPLLAWVTLKGWYIATVLLSVVVPEYAISSPRLYPLLIPEIIRSYLVLSPVTP